MFGYSRALKSKVHILDSGGRSLCKTENGGTILKHKEAHVPPGRKMCQICRRLLKAKPRLVKSKSKPPTKKKAAKKPMIGFYYSDEWRRLRFQALERYGRRCMSCGRGLEHGIVLHVDHIKPRSKYPELELSPDNVQILCEDCNLGKSNLYENDLREPSGFLTPEKEGELEIAHMANKYI